MKKETPKEKLWRIESIIAALERMVKNPLYQETVGVDELRKRAIERIKEIID